MTMTPPRPRILIVDGHTENIVLLRNALQDDGKIHFARHGKEALELVASPHKPHLILLDIGLPDMDGLELCKRLKRLHEAQEIPIIFIASRNETALEARGLELGAVDFIYKPFDRPVVRARVKTHLHLIQVYKQSQERADHLRSILESTMDAMITTDQTGVVIDFNPYAETMFGYARSETIGREISELIVPPELRARHQAGMQRYAQLALDNRAHPLKKRMEVVGLHRNGTKIYIEMAVIITFHDGQPRFTAFLHDITERHHLVQSLNDMLTIAETASRTKSDFLSKMSHEIRTPMNAIMGLTTLAQKTDPSPKMADYLAKIDNASRSMLGMINDILEFSKITTQPVLLHPAPFDLQEVFNRLGHSFKHLASEKGLELILAVSLDTTRLIGDAMRLEQVLTSLIKNAIKFTETGEILVEATALRQSGQEITIEFGIHDTGIGIDPDRLPSLFESFVQADNSLTRQYGGSGLGLAISKRIVEVMGGEIRAESRPQHGSVFYFTALFKTDSAIHREQELENQIKEKIEGARILVVEDNAINRQVVRELLERVGIQVDEAHHGKKALPMIQSGTYAAVLMDLQMPEMDGLTTTRLMRADPRCNTLPIIAMTAHVLEEDRQKCLEAGMNGHVGKPIDPRDLYAQLTRWIDMPHPPDPSRSVSLLPDLPGLNHPDGIARMGGNQELYRRLLLRFHTDHVQDAQKIADALRAQDRTLAERLTHTVRSAGGQLGAMRFHQAATALEHAISCQDPQENDLLEAFRQALQEVMHSLASLTLTCDAHPAPPAPSVAPREVDPDQIALSLNQIARLLAEQDAQSDTLLPVLSAGLHGHPAHSKIEEIAQQLQRYDYVQASEILTELAAGLGITLEAPT